MGSEYPLPPDLAPDWRPGDWRRWAADTAAQLPRGQRRSAGLHRHPRASRLRALHRCNDRPHNHYHPRLHATLGPKRGSPLPSRAGSANRSARTRYSTSLAPALELAPFVQRTSSSVSLATNLAAPGVLPPVRARAAATRPRWPLQGPTSRTCAPAMGCTAYQTVTCTQR